MYTSVTGSEESQKTLFLFARKLENILLQLIEGRLSISFGSDVIKLSPTDIIRVVSEISAKNSNELTIRNVILEMVIQCETKHRLSGLIAALSFCEFIKSHSANADIKDDLVDLSLKSKKSCLQEVNKLLKNVCKDKLSESILMSALKLSGADGRIVIDTDPCLETYVSTSSGYHFNVTCDELFARASRLEEWNRNNVLCLIIDGVVERPSELEKILYQLSENKLPAIIFARGFNEEVISTMAVNFMRGHLDVIPVCVPCDEMGINLINDIAVVSGTDIISSLKGDLISRKTFDDLVSLESVSIQTSSKTVMISNQKTKRTVSRHLRNLKKKNEKLVANYSDQNRQMEKIYEKRILSLADDGVKIKIGKILKQKRGLVLDRVQAGIGIFKDVCRLGLIDTKYSEHNNHRIKNIIKNSSIINNKIPTLSLLMGIQEGFKAANMLSKVGSLICLDE